MKILVLAKHVPDTADPRLLDAETGLLDRGASDFIPDEITERALECALQVKDQDSSVEVVVLTMGPADAEKSVRRLLAMGADRAVHVLDDALVGSDMFQTARALSAAVDQEKPDVVLAGNQSTDGRGGMVPAMVGELLGMPVLPDLEGVEISADTVRGTFRTEASTVSVESSTPVVASVTERAGEARFPSFKGIMAAKKKPVDQKSLETLGVQAGPAYAPVRSVMVSAAGAPAKQAGTIVTDDGTAVTQLVDFLASKHLI